MEAEKEGAPKTINVEELDTTFCDEVASQPGGEHVKRCFACGTCAAGCPVTDIDEEYNCRRIIRQIAFGMRDEVLASPLIWFCMLCYRCYARCPQKVNFTDVMRALRYMAIKGKHAPPDILDRMDDVERFSQMLRHDLVTHSFDGRKEILAELKKRIDEYGEKQSSS
jgi:heterodisulfide reductase subunit C